MLDYQKEKLEKIIIDIVKEKIFQPMKAKELACLLDIPKAERADLQEVLDKLVAEGKIGVSVKGKYGKRESFTHVGVFSANPRGFGFVAIEGRERDVFIPADETGAALDGDRVRIIIVREGSGQSAEGQVVQVLEHANKELVGVYRKNKNFGFLVPDNQRILKDIFIPQGKDLHAVSGQKVVCRITDYGDAHKNPEGVVTEILGHVNDPGVDILSIVRAYGLPEAFPEEVQRTAQQVPESVTEEAMQKRAAHDFRALTTITIDGEDAKDLDDAISLCWDEARSAYTLYVHIADVTEYVREGGALDKEALNRGTSVYLVDRVIPMLPHALSNGICSLNEGVDRLALSCVMQINEQGAIVGHEICESVIRVDKRMSYTGVHALLAGEALENGESIESYEPYRALLTKMHALSQKLRKRRYDRGGIDFDFPESKILLDEKGRPTAIKPYERNESNMMIEDFMLAANETVAEDYFWQELPFVYRVHENPDPEKMKQLGIFVSNFGHFIRQKGGEVHPKEIQKLLSAIAGTPEEAVIARLALRSMKQAKYTTSCEGHFGLAAGYYTHFTSPIRRYPDLQIHRIIKENLHGALGKRRLEHYTEILPAVAQRSSVLERRADEAEREVEKLKKCEYIRRYIGEAFDGVISGVTAYGIYVELANTVEGMVNVRNMDGDYYIFNEERYELCGELTGRCYKLGQKVRVRVLQADRMTRTIDFMLEPEREEEE